MEGQTPTTGANSAASPSAQSSATANSSVPATQNTGAVSTGSSSQQQQPSSKLDEGFWKTHGEEVFRHPRFQELSGFKKQWETVEPIVKQYGSVDSLNLLHEYFGPVWQSLQNMEGPKANEVWTKLYPIFSAITSGQDISPYLAQKAAAVIQQAAEDSSEDEDPISKVNKTVEELRNEIKQEKTTKQQQEMKALADANLSKYETRFKEMAKNLNIPDDLVMELGDIMVARISKYLPKGPSGKPVHPLYSYNEKAFDTCFEKEIKTLWTKMSGVAVKNAVKDGSPHIPSTHTSGGTVSGTAVPTSREAKAARMAQFFSKA